MKKKKEKKRNIGDETGVKKYQVLLSPSEWRLMEVKIIM